MKNIKAFTLVELVIVIVIVGILSIIAVPIYRGYTRKSMLTEGKSLLSSVEKSEYVYYAEFAQYYPVPIKTSFEETLNIDVRSNKYFNSFKVDVAEDKFVTITTGENAASGMSLTLESNDRTEKSSMIENNVND